MKEMETKKVNTRMVEEPTIRNRVSIAGKVIDLAESMLSTFGDIENFTERQRSYLKLAITGIIIDAEKGHIRQENIKLKEYD